MNNYPGKIVIGKISNIQAVSSGKPEETESFIPLKENNVRFVHYPDCQQLIIWLTHPGRQYQFFRLQNNLTNELIETRPVTDHLNGSIQLLWDTLPVAPGSYTIGISWKNGWEHQIEFVKQDENFVEELKKPAPVENLLEQAHEPIVYRDGFGRVIGNEDLTLRDQLNKEMLSKFSRRIEYTGTFRAGTIIYRAGETKIEFSHEMGGGNCMFYIDIPGEDQWEKQTGTPLSGRTEILEFVATTVRSQQAAGCRFEISGDAITYYYR